MADVTLDVGFLKVASHLAAESPSVEFGELVSEEPNVQGNESNSVSTEHCGPSCHPRTHTHAAGPRTTPQLSRPLLGCL